MKRFMVIFMSIAFVLIVQGCTTAPLGNNPTTMPSESITTDEPRTEPIALFGTTEFNNAIRDNPIDQAFNEIEFSTSTSDIIEINNQFRVYWEAEINSTCEKLYNLLHKKDADALRNAQRTWFEFMENNHSLRLSLFYGDDFLSQPYGVANGMLDRVFVNTTRMEETRRRALELMEYYYRFTGKIEFAFSEVE